MNARDVAALARRAISEANEMPIEMELAIHREMARFMDAEINDLLEAVATVVVAYHENKGTHPKLSAAIYELQITADLHDDGTDATDYDDDEAPE